MQRSNALDECEEFPDSGWELVFSGRFELFKVREFGNRHVDAQRPVSQKVLQFASKGGKKLIPGADCLDQCRHVPFLPKSPFIGDSLEAPKLLGPIKHCNYH